MLGKVLVAQTAYAGWSVKSRGSGTALTRYPRSRETESSVPSGIAGGESGKREGLRTTSEQHTLSENGRGFIQPKSSVQNGLWCEGFPATKKLG